GPGRYASDLIVPKGNVIAKPVATRGGRHLDGDWTILSRPYPEELARIGFDGEQLEKLAALSRGRRIERAEEVLAPSSTARPQRLALTLPLGLFGIGLFVCVLVAKRARWAKS